MARRGDNIYHRKDGRWEGRFVKERTVGRTQFGYVFGKTYREVKSKLSAARYEWQTHTKEAALNKTTFRVITVGGWFILFFTGDCVCCYCERLLEW